MLDEITQTQRIEQLSLRVEKVDLLPNEQSVPNKLDLTEMLVYFRTVHKENITLLNSSRDQEDITEQEWIELEKTIPIIELQIKKVELKLEKYYMD